MDKFQEMGMLGQKELQPGGFIRAGQFPDGSRGRKGLSQVKIRLLIGPGIDEQVGPGIGLEIGKFTRTTGGGKDNLPGVGSGSKRHEAGMGLPLILGRQHRKFLRG